MLKQETKTIGVLIDSAGPVSVRKVTIVYDNGIEVARSENNTGYYPMRSRKKDLMDALWDMPYEKEFISNKWTDGYLMQKEKELEASNGD